MLIVNGPRKVLLIVNGPRKVLLIVNGTRKVLLIVNGPLKRVYFLLTQISYNINRGCLQHSQVNEERLILETVNPRYKGWISKITLITCFAYVSRPSTANVVINLGSIDLWFTVVPIKLWNRKTTFKKLIVQPAA